MRAHQWIRLLLTVVCLLARVTPGRAAAGDEIEACFTTYEETQVLLKKQSFEWAEKSATRCSTGCPEEIAEQCRRWATEAERKAPSVLLVARHDNGNDASGVQVTVDGQERPLQVEVLLDPGPHRIRFSRADGWKYEVDVKILAEEKQRPIRAAVPLERSEVEPQVKGRTPHIPWAIASFSVGAIGLGIAGAFTIVALGQKENLDECAPVGCAREDVEQAHASLRMADVGLVVGVVGVATGVGILIWGRPEASARSASIGVAPTRGGMATVLHGRF